MRSVRLPRVSDESDGHCGERIDMSKRTPVVPAEQPLVVAIENEQLVIRVGVNVIAFVAEKSEKFQEYNMRTGQYDSLYRVADAAQLASDVVRALNKEQEDGTTPVHLLLDEAIEQAADDGSMGFHE